MDNSGKVIHEIWDTFGQNFSKSKNELQFPHLREIRDSIFCPGPFYYYIVDFSVRECSFVHESVTDFFGIEPDDFSFERILTGIHPDDLPFVVKCEEVVQRFLYENIEPEDILNYKINYCIRLKDKDDKYRLISHQALTLSTDEEGKISHVLNVHTTVDHMVNANNRKISFIGLNGARSYFGIDPFEPDMSENGQTMLYTNRELEIIRLIADGHTAEEIAAKLHISPDTVRTHRRNILSKTECRNTAQLIAKCIRDGLI